MADEGWKVGLERFLTAYCTAPAILRGAMERIGLVPRINCLFDLDYLCRQGEVADCYWIVCEGHIRVERRGGEIVLRGAGDVVGEQAFYRLIGLFILRSSENLRRKSSGRTGRPRDIAAVAPCGNARREIRRQFLGRDPNVTLCGRSGFFHAQR